MTCSRKRRCARMRRCYVESNRILGVTGFKGSHRCPATKTPLNSFDWLDKAVSLVRPIVTRAGQVLVVYLIGRMVSDLAGRTTLADISLHFLAARNARELGSYVIAAGLPVWGIR